MYKPHFKPANRPHVANTRMLDNDPIVQNGLSLTPARMLELTQQGFSISNQNARLLAEVREDAFARMDVPLEFRRHFDIADGYQAQQESRMKLRKALNATKEQKGE